MPSEDSDQTALLRSLILVFTGRSANNQGSTLLPADRKDSDQNAQVDPSLCWAQMSKSTYILIKKGMQHF